jgi:hypothetical protein
MKKKKHTVEDIEKLQEDALKYQAKLMASIWAEIDGDIIKEMQQMVKNSKRGKYPS